MQAHKEEWRRLCEQAAMEQDPLKLLQLTQEINRLLTEKEERLQATRKTNAANKYIQAARILYCFCTVSLDVAPLCQFYLT